MNRRAHVVSSLTAGLLACSFLTAAIALQPAGESPRSPQRPAGERGQPGDRGQPGERGRGDRAGGQSIESSMKGMNRAMRTLRDQVADASKKDENLRLINDIQRNCVNAKGQPLPKNILENATDEAQKEQWAREYRTKLATCLKLMAEVELAIIDGKGAEASKALDQIHTLEEQGHTDLGVKD
ncbi:MAG: collagen-like protein [Phycisphaerales bacterium]|nr:MAG: collagen-like protein [Phycisphaerales bacterium]